MTAVRSFTGAAFGLLRKPGWHGDNVASWLLADDPAEIFRRAFATAGWSFFRDEANGQAGVEFLPNG